LNDDVSVTDDQFWNDLTKEIKNINTSFTINNTFSHFVINRKELEQIGWFDERLLGIGYEDGDFCWRYAHYLKRELANVGIDNICNYIDKSAERIVNTRKEDNGYSMINLEIIHEKYDKKEISSARKFLNKPEVHRLLHHEG